MVALRWIAAAVVTAPLLYMSFISPRINQKPYTVSGKKNAQGVEEYFLNNKSGVSLLCKEGPKGPLCGSVDYWWSSIEAPARSGLVESEWPAIGNDLKRSLVGSELERALDSLYGVQGGRPAVPSQYAAGK